MTTKQFLIELRELLSDPARWTQSADARNSAGRPLAGADAIGPAAVCWCLGGGVEVIYYRYRELGAAEVKAAGAAESLLCQAVKKRGGVWSGVWGLVRFNDRPGRTHAEILALIDDAIVAADAAQEDDQ